MIPVNYQSKQSQSRNTILLATDGADVNAILGKPGDKYVLTRTTIKHPGLEPIADLNYFLASNPDVNTIEFYGYGLTENELQSLKNHQLLRRSNIEPNGIVAISWSKKIKEGEPLIVQGKYRNTTEKAVRLVFKGLGRVIDSLLIDPKSTQPFSFQDQPKQLGKAVYQLIALQQSDTVAKEPVPFEVVGSKPIKVLILASSPDFEYKFLKNWLYENAYPIAFRSQISKNKFATNFLNMDRLNLDKINAVGLKKFDLVIADEEELAALMPQERSAIATSVNGGLGLIVRISNLKASTTLSNQFLRFENLTSKNKSLYLKLSATNKKLKELPIEQTLFLRPTNNDQALITDLEGQLLVSSTLNGRGKQVYSTIQATYQWLLGGNKNEYYQFWTAILNEAAKKNLEQQSVRVSPQFPSLYESATVTVDLFKSLKSPIVTVAGAKLSPRQNMAFPFRWDARYWPQKPGWTDLEVNGRSETVYFFDKTDWRAAKNQIIVDANAQYEKKHLNNSENSVNAEKFAKKRVPQWWFFIGFLIASGFLWYESKVLATK